MPDGFRIASAWVDVSPNTDGFKEKLDAQLSGDKTAVKVQLDLDKASVDATAVKAKEATKTIGDAAPVKAKLQLDDASVAAFEARIRALTASASSSSTVQGGSPPGSTSAAGGGGGLGMGALIAGGIGLGAGVLGGAALLTIPAVFTAIGVAAEKSNEQVDAAFTGMESAAKQSLAAGFAPFVPVLIDIANQAKTTITGLEPELESAAQATAPLIQSVSTGLLTAVKEGVGGATPIIQGLQKDADAAGQGFVQLERGVLGFLQNLDPNQSAAGFTALFGSIEQILPAAGSLLSEVMPLGNALLTVLGPAVRDTVSEARVLAPVIDAATGAISFLSPAIAAYAGPAAAALTATKLLTGSWTDFGGVVTKLKSVFQDADGEFDKGRSTLDSLAKTIGITTDSAKKAAIADAQLAADKAALADATAKQNLIQAQSAAAASDTAKTRVALAEAETAEAATAKAAAAANAALADAEEASTFAMGPLGAAIAGVGLLLLPFIGNLTSSSDATNKMTGELGKLQQAASDTQALANLFKTDPQAEQQLAMLQKYGVTLKDLADANNGNAAAQQKVASAAKAASDAMDAKVVADQKDVQAMQDRVGVGGAVGTKTDEQTDALHRAKEALAADKDAQAAANATYQDAKAQLDATTAAQKAQAAAAAQSAASNGLAAMGVNTLGESLGQATSALSAFLAANPSASVGDQFLAITQDAVAAGNALQTVSDHFKQTAQAAQSAAQSYQDSLHSEAQANQAVATARQGVVTAERAVADAVANVGIAQNNETKAVVAAQQAQVNLNNARATAIEQLKSLHLQLADQVTSEESARVALFDQTAKSAALGVTSANAAAIAAETVTSTNEAQVQAAIDLMRAQQALDDTLNTGANLRTQVNAADQAGIENAPNVVSAKQALASANDQVTSAQQALVKANQAVADAETNVAKAEQGVQDALYNQQKAAQAATQAFQAMTAAQDANSHNLDLNTAAGRANAIMQAQAAQAILNSHEPLTQQIADMQSLGQQFGDSNQMGQLLIQNLAKLSGVNITFDVKGVASIDMTQLEQSLYPGSTPASIAADLKDLARGGSALFHAEGGPIEGVGGPTDDANLAFLSAGEHVWTAEEVQKAGGHDVVTALRRHIRGYAAGGAVGTNNANIATLMLTGYDDMVGSGYEIGGHLKQIFGFPFKDLPTYVPPTISPGAGALVGNGTPARGGSAAQAQAYALSQLGVYGWGPDQMPDLIKLWNQESGWNSYAVNPSSGAAGIAQSLGHGPVTLGDYIGQINWGLGYIKGRYGSPDAAWAHEVADHWYDTGGYAQPGTTLVRNGTGQTEMMLPPGMSRTLESINTAVQGGSGSGGNTTINHWNVSTQDPYTAARLVAAQQAWNNMIGAHA